MLRRLFPVLLLVAGCSGTDDETTLVRPEACDDGVDNNDNGLVDCDDKDFCGGLQCNQPTGDDDTDIVLDPLEIAYDAESCCSFTFTAADCPKGIGSFSIVNRSALDAEVDVSCDLVGTEAAIQWQIRGGDAPVPFIVDDPLYAETSATVDGFFNCAVNNAFSTHCRVKVETDEAVQEEEFDIMGEPIAR